MRIFQKLCLSVIITTVIQSAQSAEITHINVSDISIRGQIVPGDFKKFYDLAQSFGDVREANTLSLAVCAACAAVFSTHAARLLNTVATSRIVKVFT